MTAPPPPPSFEAVVHGLLRARLLSLKPHLPKLVEWQGVPFDEPDTGTEWVREAMLVDDAPHATSIGQVARVTLRGAYQIDRFGPVNRWREAPGAWAGRVRATFPRSVQLGGDGVVVDLESVLVPHGQEDRPGRWHQPTSVQWVARTFL